MTRFAHLSRERLVGFTAAYPVVIVRAHSGKSG